MKDFNIEVDEVILFEDYITRDDFKDLLKLTLTNKKIVFEKEKGFFKKELSIVDTILLDEIKIYNEKVQIDQKNSFVNIQTINKNFKIIFDNILKANKFVHLLINTITGTTRTERGVNKIKGAIDTVDDVLGIDTRNTIKGVIENGIAGSLVNGINNKKSIIPKKKK